MWIPLFPLHAVLFPGAPLPLVVFERRYLRLVDEGLDFGVVLIRRGREVGDEPEVHEVGTVASMESVETLEGGRFRVVARGVERFRILELDRGHPYLAAEVEHLPDPPAPSARLAARLRDHLAQPAAGPDPSRESGPAPTLPLVWVAGSMLRVEPHKLQALLETGDPNLAERLLAGEAEKRRRLGRTLPLPPALPTPN